MACLAAGRAAEEAEVRVTVARKLRDDRTRVRDAALAADQEANPSILPHQALALVIAANKPGYKPKPAKVNKKTRDALAVAVAELAEARAEYTRAEASLKKLSAIRGEKIVLWMNTQPKITQETVHREMVAKEQATKLAIANGEIPAPVKAEPVRQFEIDRIFAARGKVANRMPVYRGPR